MPGLRSLIARRRCSLPTQAICDTQKLTSYPAVISSNTHNESNLFDSSTNEFSNNLTDNNSCQESDRKWDLHSLFQSRSSEFHKICDSTGNGYEDKKENFEPLKEESLFAEEIYRKTFKFGTTAGIEKNGRTHYVDSLAVSSVNEYPYEGSQITDYSTPSTKSSPERIVIKMKLMHSNSLSNTSIAHISSDSSKDIDVADSACESDINTSNLTRWMIDSVLNEPVLTSALENELDFTINSAVDQIRQKELKNNNIQQISTTFKSDDLENISDNPSPMAQLDICKSATDLSQNENLDGDSNRNQELNVKSKTAFELNIDFATDICDNRANQSGICGDQLNQSVICGNQVNQSAICDDQVNPSVICYDQVNRSVICYDQVNPSVICNNQVNQSVISNNQVNQSIMYNDQLNQSVICNDQVNQSVICNDQINQYVMSNDQVNQSVMWNDQVNQSIICNDQVNQSVVGNDQVNQSVMCTNDQVIQFTICDDKFDITCDTHVKYDDPQDRCNIEQENDCRPSDRSETSEDSILSDISANSSSSSNIKSCSIVIKRIDNSGTYSCFQSPKNKKKKCNDSSVKLKQNVNTNCDSNDLLAHKSDLKTFMNFYQSIEKSSNPCSVILCDIFSNFLKSKKLCPFCLNSYHMESNLSVNIYNNTITLQCNKCEWLIIRRLIPKQIVVSN